MDWKDFGSGPFDPWEAVEALPFADEMRACVQDPVFHGEGDVLTHTAMVLEALQRDPAHLAATPGRRRALSWAALLHDVAKPRTRAEEHDPVLGRVRVTHKGHALKGARQAWAFMWRNEVPRDVRLATYGLVLWHQRVFHLMDQEDPRRHLAEFSQVGRWDDLVTLAKADNEGRSCPDAAETADVLELTRMLAEESGCLDAPWAFASPEARVEYVRRRGASPFYEPMGAAGSRVVVLSGLPGSGKDTYAERALGDVPRVSLDAARARLGIRPGENDGRAVAAAYEEARAHLRARAPFVWNATNVTRLQRDKIIDLCLAYGARVEIHAVERPERVTASQNRNRDARVPDAVMERMIGRWEPPTEVEAHALVWV